MRLYLSSFGIGRCPEELLALLRGRKHVAVVLNAKDGSSEEGRAKSLAEEMRVMTTLGLEPTELDLRKFFGRSDLLRETLSEIDLVWVRGGNSFVLRRALRQSGADEILCEFLRLDKIVYGGFSAGVCVLSPSLSGLETVDDPTTAPAGYEVEPVWDGLGLLPYAVAPHYRSDHPESPAIERLVQRFIDDRTLFKVLRDGEAIVVDGEKHVLVG